MPSTGPAGSNMSSTLLVRGAPTREGAGGGDRTGAGAGADHGSERHDRRRSSRQRTNTTTAPTTIGTTRRATDIPAASTMLIGLAGGELTRRGPDGAEVTPLVWVGVATPSGVSTSRSPG